MKHIQHRREIRHFDLFAWADDHERMMRAPIIARRLSRLHGLPISTAAAIAGLAGIGGAQ